MREIKLIKIMLFLTFCSFFTPAFSQTDVERRFQESQRNPSAQRQLEVEQRESRFLAAERDYEDALKFSCVGQVYAFFKGRVYMGPSGTTRIQLLFQMYRNETLANARRLSNGWIAAYERDGNLLTIDKTFNIIDTVDIQNRIRHRQFDDGEILRNECRFLGGNINAI